VVEAGGIEPPHHLHLRTRSRLENPVTLHEETIVVDERRVAHERLDDAPALGPFIAAADRLEQVDDELGVSEGGIDEDFAGVVIAGAEHGVGVGTEHTWRHGHRSPPENEVKGAVPALHDDTRHTGMFGSQDLDIDYFGGDAGLAEGTEG
jgi:hypothetical protein